MPWVVPEIRQVRRDLKIDYGKIDFAIDSDGIPVLYDVNKTIGIEGPGSELARELARKLADGIQCLTVDQSPLSRSRNAANSCSLSTGSAV